MKNAFLSNFTVKLWQFSQLFIKMKYNSMVLIREHVSHHFMSDYGFTALFFIFISRDKAAVDVEPVDDSNLREK